MFSLKEVSSFSTTSFSIIIFTHYFLCLFKPQFLFLKETADFRNTESNFDSLFETAFKSVHHSGLELDVPRRPTRLSITTATNKSVLLSYTHNLVNMTSSKTDDLSHFNFEDDAAFNFYF